MKKLASCALALGLLVFACSSDDTGGGGLTPVGPPPASKDEAAQDLAKASTAVQGALSKAATGTVAKQSTGLTPQTTVTRDIAGAACQAGGTVDIHASVETNTAGGSSGAQSAAEVSYTLTAHGCKTADGYTLEGGPLTLYVKATTQMNVEDGGFSASSSATVRHNGSLTITGPQNLAVSYQELSIVSTASTSSGNGSASSSVNVTINGSATINGSTFSFSNESYSVNYSR